MEFSGQVALVTGAGGGMGARFAQRFAALGANVICADIRGEAAAEVAAEIETQGGRALAVTCDVTRPAQIEAAVAAGVKAFGRLDIAVANAGITHDQGFLDVTESAWDNLMAINCKGLFFTYQIAARQMIAQGGGGRLIGISSVAGQRGRPVAASYAASKAAVISITRSAAIGFAEHQITANCLCPGLVITPMWEKIDRDRFVASGWAPGHAFEEVRSRTPLGRGATMDEVANLVLFLASSQAAFITGEDILIDGGMLAK
jgi:meso-butanediol dehydrogenase/(S,S)-butanediol dehydrogenase/diacetyl reductase